MPSPVQFNISVGTLPPNFTGTPQDFLNAVASLLQIAPVEDWNSFLVGSSAPTANLGPWLKDGQEWWVWSDVVGAYVPLVLDSKSLRYIITSSIPSSSDYDVWIQTDSVTGVPQAIKIYQGGNWVDVYAATLANYYSKSELNTAFPKFSSSTGSNQYIVAGSASQKVEFDNAIFQVGTGFSAVDHRYTVPTAGYWRFASSLRFDCTSSSSPTSMSFIIEIRVNGVPKRVSEFYVGSDVNGTTLPVDGIFSLSANDYVEVWVQVGIASGTATWQVTSDDRKTVFEGHRLV